MTTRHRRILITIALGMFPVAAWMFRNVLLIGSTSAMHHTGELFMVEKLGAPFTFYAGQLGLVGILLVTGLVAVALWQRTRTVALLVLVVIGHVAAVYLPSLVTQMNGLDDRLLFPITAMAAVLVTVSVERLKAGWKYRVMIAAALFTLPTVTGLDFAIGGIYQPPERALWAALPHDGAAYFVSGNALMHQVYADMPQVVVWDSTEDWVRVVGK